MKFNKINVSILSLLLIVLLSSCVTQTRVSINTDIDGATVYIDGQKMGITPLQVTLSNAIWEDPDIVIKKEGYRDLYSKLNMEVKPVNAIFGLLFWYPSLLWCYGPKPNQYYFLTPEN